MPISKKAVEEMEARVRSSVFPASIDPLSPSFVANVAAASRAADSRLGLPNVAYEDETALRVLAMQTTKEYNRLADNLKATLDRKDQIEANGVALRALREKLEAATTQQERYEILKEARALVTDAEALLELM